MRKNEINKFFRWIRNGTCFAFTWLMIIILAGCMIQKKSFLSVEYVGRLLILCVGGSIIFSSCFTKMFLRSSGFSRRLFLFFLIYGTYQSLGFWWLGIIFAKVSDWLIYIGGILISYGICKIIYVYYSKKTGALYMEALNRYKSMNGMEAENNE